MNRAQLNFVAICAFGGDNLILFPLSSPPSLHPFSSEIVALATEPLIYSLTLLPTPSNIAGARRLRPITLISSPFSFRNRLGQAQHSDIVTQVEPHRC